MSTSTVKALAAGVLLACGLGGTTGSVWLSAAQAQRPGAAEARPDQGAELRALRAKVTELEERLQAATAQRGQATLELSNLVEYSVVLGDASPPAKPLKTFRTARHEYVLVAVGGVGADALADLVTAFEAKGWEYAGAAPAADDPACVFRKPVGSPTVLTTNGTLTLTRPAEAADPAAKPAKPAAPVMAPATPAKPAKPANPAVGPGQPAEVIDAVTGQPTTAFSKLTTFASPAHEAQRLQAEVSALQARLAALTDGKPTTVRFAKGDTHLEPVTLAHLLTDLGRTKFAGKITVSVDGDAVKVTGDKAVTDWAATLVGSLRK